MRDEVRQATQDTGGDASQTKEAQVDGAGATANAATAQSAELLSWGAGALAADGEPGGADLATLQARSPGVALDPALARTYSGRLGVDLSDVKVHTDAAADEAARSIGARAYVVDRHVYFSADAYAPGHPDGERLLAHELIHIAQGAGRSAGGGAPKISAPSDPAEQESATLGDAAARGETVEVGDAPADTVHRDAMGDLDEALSGDWLGSVDGATVVTRFRALTDAQRQAMVTQADHRAKMTKAMKALNGLQVTQIFSSVPRDTLDLRWKIYWIIVGGQIADLSLAQWRWLAVYNGPADWQALRAYATGYRAFLRNCPLELIPPWDILMGVKDGHQARTPAEVRDAVNQLNVAQGQSLLGDSAMLRAVLRAAGTAHEAFRTLSYVNATITQSVTELDHLGHLPALPDADWGTLLGEATRAEVDALASNAALWAKVEANCPAGIIQAARGATQQVDDGTGLGTTEANINNQLDDPIQLSALLRTMGPAGFLGLACAQGADVAGNYGKIKAAGKVPEVVAGLQPAQRMSSRTTAHLKQWFLAETASVALSQQMFGKRFNVTAGGTGAYDHTAGGTSGTTPGNWTIPGLVRAWTVLERLPPGNVEQNMRLVHMLRDTSGSDGGAYYGHLINDPNNRSGDVMMGYQNLGATRTDAAFGPGVFSANGRGAGTAAININVFNATLRHEIGHAVDRQLGVMDTWGSQDVAGNWAKYDSYREFVDAIIAGGGGLGTAAAPRHGYPAADVGVYRRAMIRAVSQTQSFQAALTAIKPSAQAAPDAGPIAAVFQTNRWTGGGSGPWYNPSNYKPQAGRSYQRAYGDADGLYSFKDSVRQARGVTQYQWRAPGEWFAEVYQVYYAEQENSPTAAVGGILRSKDPAAAEMVSTIVDRGHSPQQMQDGTTAAAPGTT